MSKMKETREHVTYKRELLVIEKTENIKNAVKFYVEFYSVFGYNIYKKIFIKELIICQVFYQYQI